MCVSFFYPVLSTVTKQSAEVANTPQIDLTITISVIIALCAIITPLITTLLNNQHQLKIKKLELEQVRIENTVLYKRSIF